MSQSILQVTAVKSSVTVIAIVSLTLEGRAEYDLRGVLIRRSHAMNTVPDTRSPSTPRIP